MFSLSSITFLACGIWMENDGNDADENDEDDADEKRENHAWDVGGWD